MTKHDAAEGKPAAGSHSDRGETTRRKPGRSNMHARNIRRPFLIVAKAPGRHEHNEARWQPVGWGLHLSRGAEATAERALNLDDPLVSRRHAVVEVEGGGRVTLTDLGSSNGTLVDGEHITERRALREGAIIAIGDCLLCYRSLTIADVEALQSDATNPVGPVPTLSPTMAHVFQRLRGLAKTNLEVLFTGESGVGKEVCARALHKLSGKAGPFVAINCASLPEHLLESELFGYAKGAHSTATQAKPGLIEQADGGTLFLDEIGDMSSSAQAKLLRFLQDQCFTPLGSATSRKANTRIVAATRLAIADSTEGRRGLRPDLAARLGPEPITIPPLRDRKEDIPGLAKQFLGEHGARIDTEALRLLVDYDWPANVRELMKALALAVALSAAGPILPEHLPSALRTKAPTQSQSSPTQVAVLDMLESRRRKPRPSPDELLELLRQHEGNVAAVARSLGRQRTAVWRWMREDGHTQDLALSEQEEVKP